MANITSHPSQLAFNIDQFLEKNHQNEVDKKVIEDVSNVFHIDSSLLRENDETWTDSDIIIFVERYLMASLSTLASGYAGKSAKEEIRKWLIAEDMVNPLSFVNCCIMLGYDAEELRSRALLAEKRAVSRDI